MPSEKKSAPPPHGRSAPLQERIQSRLFDAPRPPAAKPAVSDAVARPTVAPPSPPRTDSKPARAPITISELTDRLSRQLALGFSSVCVMGEISKVQTASSGHLYFTLKDAFASIEAMVWADNRAALAVEPKQGLRVVAVGSVRVFPPAGRYSLHVEALELVGAGDLQKAFEDLKARLLAEGLFDPSRKRSLPTLLSAVGLVTSATGAVRHDIERTLTAGDARVRVILAPARVQGEGASAEVADAVRHLGTLGLDAIIVARGGGSLEDLWPFNEEALARAIAASPVPVISAVGHETDFTICDFVSDIRASTPSVAAAMIVDIQRQARQRTRAAAEGLLRAMAARREALRRRLDAVSTHRVIERENGRLTRLRSRLDASLVRAGTVFDIAHAGRRAAARDLTRRCEAQAPHQVFARTRGRIDLSVLAMRAAMAAAIGRSKARAEQAFASRGLRSGGAERLALSARLLRERQGRLGVAIRPVLENRRSRFAGVVLKLEALSPLSVLSRGYALATAADGRILTSVSGVEVGDTVTVRLAEGRLKAAVTEVLKET